MTQLCHHGLPAWSCPDPLRAPGTDDEAPLPRRYVGLLPLVMAAFVLGCYVVWRAAR